MNTEKLRLLYNLPFKKFLEAVDGSDEAYWQAKHRQLREALSTLLYHFDDDSFEALLKAVEEAS